MANFPTSATTFATRSNGQTIDASHINSLQEEVAALESGYLDGNARLNSSNSTVVTLSVSGNSTFTGGVQVTGPSTFSTVATFSTKIAPASTTVMIGDSTTAFKEVHCSSLYVAGTAFSLAATYLRVSGSSTPISSGGSTAAITWLTEDEISDTNMHSTATNAERFTPQTTGAYTLTATLALSSVNGTASTRHYIAEIFDSSGGVVGTQTVGVPEAGGGGGIGISITVSGLKRFDSVSGSTQYLRVSLTNHSASTASLNPNLSNAFFTKV